MSLVPLGCPSVCVVLATETNSREHLPGPERRVHVTDPLTQTQAHFSLHKDEFQDYFITNGERSVRQRKMALGLR